MEDNFDKEISRSIEAIKSYTFAMGTHPPRYKVEGTQLAGIEWFSLCAMVKTGANAKAFLQALEANNVLICYALIRLQIDVALRIYGFRYFEDVDQAGEMLMEGAKYNSIPANPKRLSDKTLVDLMEQEFSGLKELYEYASEDVHLTGKVIQRQILPKDGLDFVNMNPLAAHLPKDDRLSLVQSFEELMGITKDLLEKFFASRPGVRDRMRGPSNTAL